MRIWKQEEGCGRRYRGGEGRSPDCKAGCLRGEVFLARCSVKGLMDSLMRESTPCGDVEVDVMPDEDLLLVLICFLRAQAWFV